MSLGWIRSRIGIRTIVIGAFILGMGVASLGFGSAFDRTTWIFSALLGIGLLNSTFGIQLGVMSRQDWWLVVRAVTIGVAAKAVIIASLMYGLTALVGPEGGELRFIVIAIAVAQIDPLSVGALMGTSRLSVRAENLLRAWAALDDPITVVLTLAVIFVLRMSGIDAGISFESVQIDSIAGLGTYTIQNIALMATLFFFWERACRTKSAEAKLLFTLAFMAGGIVIGATWFWMFGIALLGLVMRPDDERVSARVGIILERATTWAFYIAAVIVGALIWKHGIDLWYGGALGTSAFLSQAIVASLLVYRQSMSRQDHLYLAAGHQNGITACLLALATGTASIIVPAIVTTHILHFVSNGLIERHYRKIVSVPEPQ